MTYPLYAAEWGLDHTTTTAIFAIYPIVVVGVLIGFGDISDYIGRRITMLLGVAASMMGVLLFAIAPGVGWVFVGRAFMGVGVGLAASPAAAAMIEFSAPGQSRRASGITAAAQSLGLAAATLVGGALIEYAPYPTRLNFWTLLVVLAALFIAAWFLPRQRTSEMTAPWRPKLPTIHRGLRVVFATAVTAVTGGFALGAVMLSLGSQIAHDVIGSGNALVNGAALALFAVAAGAVASFAKRLPSGTAIKAGGVATTTGMLLLASAAAFHSLPLFLGAAVAAGAGYSLGFMGGLGLLSANAPAEHRAGALSALYLVAYLLQGVIALALGVVATAWGLGVAVETGAAVIALISMSAIGLAVSTCRSPSSGNVAFDKCA